MQVDVSKSKQCWCVNDLRGPNPDTGDCDVKNDGHIHDRVKNGVLYHHNINDILLGNDENVTSGYIANETSSILRLSNDESSSLLQITLPVFGSFIFVIIIIMLICIYRRRFRRKHYSCNRTGDTCIRNNDGVLLLDRMSNVSRNPTYFCANSAFLKRHNVPEVSSENLKLLEVVGEGAFGQVFKGDLFMPDNESHQHVAVKVLKDRTTFEVQEDFQREVETMATFDHDNILKLLGIVVQGTEGSPYMIFEYMEYGNLSELLRQNDPALKSPNAKQIIFTKADLVDVSVQIANGMSYLAAQRFVHRDLATRNCLVGNGLIVKVADFGMSRDIYTNDYYRIGCSRMMPVRWMSPEAIKYGCFTSESDIWAYGILLWEIFTFGKQPYYGHTNEEVIHFLDQGILLQRPEDCPSTIYHVMLGCWKRNPRERISFDRLGKHLTDFRNRLAKQPYTHHHYHQQQMNPHIDNTSNTENVAADIENKVNVLDDSCSCAINLEKYENTCDLDYLCPKNLDIQGESSIFKCPGFETEVPYSNIKNAVNKINDDSLKSTIESQGQAKNIHPREKLTEACQIGFDSVFPKTNPYPGNDTNSGDTVAEISNKAGSTTCIDLTKTTTLRQFLNLKDTHDGQDTFDTSQTENGNLICLPGHASQTPPSLKYNNVKDESDSPPVSVLELCPELTTLSRNTIASVNNPNYMSELFNQII